MRSHWSILPALWSLPTGAFTARSVPLKPALEAFVLLAGAHGHRTFAEEAVGILGHAVNACTLAYYPCSTYDPAVS